MPTGLAAGRRGRRGPAARRRGEDRAVRDYRSYLITVAKRATATVNKHLAALQDFYVWRGRGPYRDLGLPGLGAFSVPAWCTVTGSGLGFCASRGLERVRTW